MHDDAAKALQRMLGLRAKVEIVAPGTFPRTDFKARRVIDDRAVLARIEAMNRTWAQINEEVAQAREDAHLGWNCYTTATVTAYEVAGDHMTLVREPQASALARVMRAGLAG